MGTCEEDSDGRSRRGSFCGPGRDGSCATRAAFPDQFAMGPGIVSLIWAFVLEWVEFCVWASSASWGVAEHD
jgi:hypothetical protein